MPAGRCVPNVRRKCSWPSTASTQSAASTFSSVRSVSSASARPRRSSDSGVGTNPIGVSTAAPPPSDSLEDPLQDAQVVAEARPEELAVFGGAEPVHAEDPRRTRQRAADVEPVLPVVAHVVAAEGQHRHRVAPEHADLARRGGGRLGRQRGAEKRAVLPRERLVDERHTPLTPRAKQDRVNRDAVGIRELRRERRALGGRRREAAVRVRGLLGRRRRPRASLPVERLGRRRIVVPFPPRRAVWPQRDVRVDRVAPDHVEGRRVRPAARSGRDAEEAGLGVHGPQAAVVARAQPRDVVADRAGFPAGHRRRRHEHRQVRLAARGWKRPGDVVLASFRRLQPEDQHVLGQPAFAAREPARQPQCEALLAEKRVAAVARAHGPHGVRLGEMHDEPAIGAEVAERVEAPREVVRVAERVERDLADARHDPHVQDHVAAVGDLDADFREPRSRRAHQKRHHEQGAALHRAVEERRQLRARLRRAPSSCSSAPRRPCSPC